PSGIPVARPMTGDDVVVAKAEVLPEVACLHGVDIDAKSETACKRTVEPFRPHAAEHLLEISCVHAVVLIGGELVGVRDLEHRDRELRAGQILAQESAYSRE